MWSRDIDELGMLNESQKGAQCSRVVKLILISFMVFILVGGIAILGIGIWTHEVEYGSKQMAGLVGVALYQADSLMMIACGTATIVLIAVGLLGLLIPQKCLLGLHLSVITFVAVTLFAAGILGYVFVGELEDTVRGSLKKSVTNNYGLKGEESITKAWDNVQQTFKCCGAYGGRNTSNSWYLYYSESFWVKDHYNPNGSYVPESCCGGGDIDMCMGKINISESWPPRTPPPVISVSPNYTLYMDGCYDKLSSYLEQNGILIGTAAVVVGVFMIVEIGLTIFMYRTLH